MRKDNASFKKPTRERLDFQILGYEKLYRFFKMKAFDSYRFARYAKLKVVKMNIEESPETPTNLGVRGLPTLMLFKGGEAVATHSGGITKSKLSAWINERM